MAKTKIIVEPRYIQIRYRADSAISGVETLYINRRQITQVKLDKDDGFLEVTFALTGQSLEVLKFTVGATADTAKIVDVVDESGKSIDAGDFDNHAKMAKLFAAWMV